MVGTQKIRKFFPKYYCLQGVPEGESFKKYDIYDKNDCFPAPIFLYATNGLPCNIPFERALHTAENNIICQYNVHIW